MTSLLDALTPTGLPPNPTPVGTATVCYRVGDAAPVLVTTALFQNVSNPQSLNLALYNPAPEPIDFLMTIGIESFYLGPGEYKGNAQDVQIGLGLVEKNGDVPVWTAGQTTFSDLTTYVVPAGELVGTCAVTGLVPGPLFGPPDNPPPAGQPNLTILFCYFSVLNTTGGA